MHTLSKTISSTIINDYPILLMSVNFIVHVKTKWPLSFKGNAIFVNSFSLLKRNLHLRSILPKLASLAVHIWLLTLSVQMLSIFLLSLNSHSEELQLSGVHEDSRAFRAFSLFCTGKRQCCLSCGIICCLRSSIVHWHYTSNSYLCIVNWFIYTPILLQSVDGQ